jgi:predicted porin
MKKSLLALAVLGAFAGAASAQSSVTLFGVIDQSITRQSSGGAHLTAMTSNQLSSNRLGFKGVEDLGGGLSANFWLEAGMANQTGQGADASGGLYFNRQSTIALVSKQAGEVRIGHDYDPTFWNWVFFDVFGANGLGEGLNFALPLLNGLGSGAATAVRVNNSVSYFLPSNLGGLYGQVQGALQNGTVTPANSNKYYGGRIGWAGYGFDVAGAYGDTKTAPVFSSDYKHFNVGASYDFGLAKVYGLWAKATFDPTAAEKNSSTTEELSVGIPVGLGAINASYAHNSSTIGGLSGTANQYGLQFLYNVSKRTTLYVGGAQISNKSNADFNFGVDAASIPVAAGASITGYNAGIRHSF